MSESLTDHEAAVEPLDAALAAVVDPLLARPIGELGYVRGAQRKRRGSIVIDLLMPVPGQTSHDLVDAVTAAAKTVEGVNSVRRRHGTDDR